MKLVEAIKEFESFFPNIKAGEENKDLPKVCSGGLCGLGEVYPALYSSEERAIKSWLEVARANVPSKSTTLEWLSKPELIKYQITMADMKRGHRLVSDRFVVKSQFMVS